MRKVTNKGLDLIKKWESLKIYSYICPAGKKTIGYGHVILKNDNIIEPINEELAILLLLNDCKIAESCINKYVTVDITPNQFDALVSLIFNVGVKAFRNSKGLIYLNNNELNIAAEEFFSRDKGFVFVNGRRNKGLINRRLDEHKLWSL